jgi:hypothetical protein
MNHFKSIYQFGKDWRHMIWVALSWNLRLISLPYLEGLETLFLDGFCPWVEDMNLALIWIEDHKSLCLSVSPFSGEGHDMLYVTFSCLMRAKIHRNCCSGVSLLSRHLSLLIFLLQLNTIFKWLTLGRC